MHTKSKALLIVFVLILTGNIFWPVSKAYGQSGKETIAALINIFAKNDSASFSKSQLNEAAAHIDYQSMAKQALGYAYWTSMSTQQKTIYVDSFKSLIEQRYYKRWRNIFSKSKINYTAEEKLSSGNILVKTEIATGDSNKTITWTVSGENSKVINLTVDEEDLIRRANSRFKKKIASANIAAFISWIQNKAKHPDQDKS